VYMKLDLHQILKVNAYNLSRMKFKFTLILIKIVNLDITWNLYSHRGAHVHVRTIGGGIGSSSFPVTDFGISSVEL
jgi:hypothetical protein